MSDDVLHPGDHTSQNDESGGHSAYAYEYAYGCSECGHSEWRRELPRLGANCCPECGCPMTDAAKRLQEATA